MSGGRGGRAYSALKWRLKHFYWHRIIADEFHELIGAAVDGEHPFNEAKHQLTAPGQQLKAC